MGLVSGERSGSGHAAKLPKYQLAALATDPTEWRYGYELGQVGLKAGSLYPILMRLSDRGLLENSWETDPTRPAASPPLPTDCCGRPVLAAVVAALNPIAGLRADRRVHDAGLIATLTITVSTQGLLQLFPGHVPPIVNSVVPPGTSAADILANNEIEANDPYMAVTIVGFLLAIVMAIVLIRRYSVQSKGNASVGATAIALADPSGPASRG